MTWTNNQEDFLRRLHLECNLLAEYNRKQYILYSNINRRFSIPILVISGINSLFAVSTQPFLEQGLISITNACLSLFCGILGSIQLFMKIDSKIHNYVVCSHEFNKLSYKLSKELTLEREVRVGDGKQFVVDQGQLLQGGRAALQYLQNGGEVWASDARRAAGAQQAHQEMDQDEPE